MQSREISNPQSQIQTPDKPFISNSQTKSRPISQNNPLHTKNITQLMAVPKNQVNNMKGELNPSKRFLPKLQAHEPATSRRSAIVPWVAALAWLAHDVRVVVDRIRARLASSHSSRGAD